MGFGHKKPDGATVLLKCSEGQVPDKTGIDFLDFLGSLDPDTDTDTDSDNDQTHRKPLPEGDAGDT